MSRYTNRELYFTELYTTSRKYYLDYIRRSMNLDKNSRILEIGCGEGGNLLPFAEFGCNVSGIDISESKISNAKQFFEKRGGVGVEFTCGNFLEMLEDTEGFYIILIHDAIEHINPESKLDFFKNKDVFEI